MNYYLQCSCSQKSRQKVRCSGRRGRQNEVLVVGLYSNSVEQERTSRVVFQSSDVSHFPLLVVYRTLTTTNCRPICSVRNRFRAGPSAARQTRTSGHKYTPGHAPLESDERNKTRRQNSSSTLAALALGASTVETSSSRRRRHCTTTASRRKVAQRVPLTSPGLGRIGT